MRKLLIICVFIFGSVGIGFTQIQTDSIITEYSDTVFLKLKYDFMYLDLDTNEEVQYLNMRIKYLEMEMIRLDDAIKYENELRNQRMYYYGGYPPWTILNTHSIIKFHQFLRNGK